HSRGATFGAASARSRRSRNAPIEMVGICLNAATETIATSADEQSQATREPLCPQLRGRAIRGLLAALPEYVFVLDRGLTILVATRNVGQRTPEELEGRPVLEVFPPHLHPVARATLH